MSIHYLDNSATTAASESAAAKALYMMTECYGNPSSLHGMGLSAETEVESARSAVADSLGVSAREILFTSGGTEANNTALFGAAEALKRRGNRIIVSAVEHSSVRESAHRLSGMGFDVQTAPVDGKGIVILDELAQLINDKTILLSIMAVNNETGSIQPTEQISKLLKSRSRTALFHVDAVQAYCKIPLKPKRWGVDLMTVSAHKIHGPKGVGALYIRDGARITPLIYGGEQQHKLRPGTESSPLIAAFGQAVREANISANLSIVSELSSYAKERVTSIDGVTVNSPDDALPYIINLSVEGIRSETILHHLESLGVYVSSSSACSKGKPSYVLSAMGIPADRVDSSIRVSFSKHNTKDDIDALYQGITSGIATLQKK